MTQRRKLPPRRPSVTRDVVWQRTMGAHKFSVTIGFDPRSGKVSEVFASGARGSDMESTISDACVMLSHALQCGADAHAISLSLLKVSDPSSGGHLALHASVLGAISECVAEVADATWQGGRI